MRKFEIKLLVEVIKEWANVGIIHIEVKDTKEIDRKI